MDNWDYGAGEQIDPKILADYESEDFDVGDIADDYAIDDLADEIMEMDDFDDGFEEDEEEEEEEEAEKNKEEATFLNPDEKLQQWEFDGLDVEKHSKGYRSRQRKQRKQERQEAKAAEKEEARAAEEAARLEAEQQAAFERVSKTVQAPIASAITGTDPVKKEDEVNGD